MKLFRCQDCGNRLHFESFECVRCKRRVGYLPEQRAICALAPVGERARGKSAAWQPVGQKDGRYRLCRNATEHEACNWLIPQSERNPFCRSCRLSLVLPDLDAPEALGRWRTLERAKRRLVYGIDQLGLPLEGRQERPRDGLAFVFLTQGDLGRETVLTGHSNGMVTINVNEADDAYRENMRKEMREAYRTVLGHFRHEVGHYYWNRLVADTPWLERVRAMFGDERKSYAEACERHYREGPPDDWQDEFVSAYATMHPWEDWAESWSHYLHITDTLDTANAYALTLGDSVEARHPADTRYSLLHEAPFSDTISEWLDLAEVLNSLNRSMGLADPYPFVLGAPSIEKLALVHEIVRSVRAS
jgi:hypothetical protein